MNQLDIIEHLGPNATLLLRSDEWLDAKRHEISSELTRLSQELGLLLFAIQIKRSMQQKNLVAVKLPYNIGEATDDMIEIMPLPDAIEKIRNSAPDASAQLHIWKSDGYDVKTSKRRKR